MYMVNQFISDNKVFLIRDPIYGFIEMPRILKSVVDHPLVQRLRWISQLPLEQIVYPSAQHSRFEHSIGTMHLAIRAAIALLNDKISRERLMEAKDKESHSELKDLNEREFKEVFVVTAGLVGLLHDVGHGPFSHTLEDVSLYTTKKFSFDHETLSFIISKQVLDSFGNTKVTSIAKKIALKVLNKKREIQDLLEASPIVVILRKLIDGPIDVDKGDYLLRDSYHCGVTYGIYGKERLWRHIRLTEGYKLGVSPKGALEAWTLRFARYKMYKNVYKHHVRNITDSLLIDTIVKGIEKTEIIEEIIPFANTTTANNLNDKDLLALYHWTDNELLKKLDELNIPEVTENMERFRRRKLPKRFLSVVTGTAEPEKDKILTLKNKLYKYNEPCGVKLYFMWFVPPSFPIYDKSTMSLKVVEDSGEELFLVEFLSMIKLKKDHTIEDLIEPESLVIEIYADSEHTCGDKKEELKELIEEIFGKRRE